MRGRLLGTFKEGELHGLCPSKPKAIINLDGQFHATPADSLQRWN